MEKQTMGKFIAALRKANGMTQSEIAEKLGVSNKSVSKWECDDGYPDLSLIPLIAEIFNVTSDEILKGGRIASNTNTALEQPKTDKQVNLIIQKTLVKFKNLSLIAIFLGVIGLIMFFLPLLILLNGGVNSTFFFIILTVFSIIFILASIIFEIILTNNAKSAIYGFDTSQSKYILKAQKTLSDWSFHIIALDILIFLGSIMPLTNKLTAYSLLLLPAIFVFAHLIKMFLTEKIYYEKTEQPQLMQKLKKLNIIFLSISLTILVVPLVIYIVPDAVYHFSTFGTDRFIIVLSRYFSIQLSVIAVVGVIYISLRKMLLKDYSKLK